MWSLILILFLHCDVQAQAPKSPSKLNTNLYEQEPEEEKSSSFTSKVRVVRDISDDVEVFFESDKASGAYTLPRAAQNYSKMFKDLEKSKAPGGPAVSVTADSEKRIKSVEIQSGGASGSSNPWKIDYNL
ncbi:hypothetical protein D3C87_300780 [compost metagenome]